MPTWGGYEVTVIMGRKHARCENSQGLSIRTLGLSLSLSLISVPLYHPVIWSFSLNLCVPLIFLLFSFDSNWPLCFSFKSSQCFRV